MVYKPTNTTGGHHQRHGQIFGKRGALADSTIGTVPVDVHWQRDKKAATMWQLPAINQTAECIYIYYNKIIYIYIYIYTFGILSTVKSFLSKRLCCKQNCGVLNPWIWGVQGPRRNMEPFYQKMWMPPL